LFHTYESKVFTDNQISQIKYNYYINNVSKDYDDYQAKRNGTTKDFLLYKFKFFSFKFKLRKTSTRKVKYRSTLSHNKICNNMNATKIIILFK
jgi:hypothetical protein